MINLTNNIKSEISIDLSSNFIKDFSNISISYETSHINNIKVDLRFNEIQSITNENLRKAKSQKIKYDLSYNPLSKSFVSTLGLDSDYLDISRKTVYNHFKNINFKSDEIENPIFRNLKKWSDIQKFSILTGKNGIGKSSVLNYIQKTSSEMLNSINISSKFEYKGGFLLQKKKEIQHIILKYENVFDLLPIDIDENLLNSESKLKINKLYLPVIYRMHDTIRPIKTPRVNIRETIKRFFSDPLIDLNKFDRNLIEIFFLELSENNDIFDTLILKNFGNKLELLNKHLTQIHDFKYKIDINKDGLIEFVDVDEKAQNRVRSEHMSPGEQLKILFYIWEFTLSRFRLPFTPVLLLDEPDAHLHPKAVHEFVEILEKLSDAGAQIIMTTHNPTTVSFAKEENLFYMKENIDKNKNKNKDRSITIHKAKSKADAIYELTENLVAVNIPFLTILVEGEGDDNRFYDLVRQKLVDLGNSYICQFIFKGFKGCDNIIKFITEQVDLKLDHFGIVDNDNHLEICSNNTIDINKYYETRKKNVYNLLRHSLENYVLDPISLYFYLKHLNSSNNQDLKVDCEENSPFKILNDKLDSEIGDPIKFKKLRDIESVDDFIHCDIDDGDKVKILQTIVNIMGQLIIDYLTEFVCFNPRLFYDKRISNLTPFLRFVETELAKSQDKDFSLLNFIDFYILGSKNKGVDEEFNKRWISKKKIIDEKCENNENKSKDSQAKQISEIYRLSPIKENDIIKKLKLKISSLEDKKKAFENLSEIYKSFIKAMKEVIKTCDLQESKFKEDLDDINKLLNEINQLIFTGIDISILQDFSDRKDNDPLNDNTTVTKQQLKDYINNKHELDKYFVEKLKEYLKETIECHFVYKDDEDLKEIKINYPKVFYCLQGHYLEDTVCKMFFLEKKKKICLVKEIIKEVGLFEKCGYLIPNELKEIFDQINKIKENLLEEEKREKLRREQEQ